MKVLLLAIGLLGIAIAAIAVKMFVIEGATFKKSCSSANPDPKKRIGCTCGENTPGQMCDKYEEHHGVNAKNRIEH